MNRWEVFCSGVLILSSVTLFVVYLIFLELTLSGLDASTQKKLWENCLIGIGIAGWVATLFDKCGRKAVP